MATVSVTASDFEPTVLDNDLVLVDFWASWCGPCRMFAPIYEEVSDDHPDVVFAKVDTEAHPELAAAFEIRSIPTLMAFREGIRVFSQAGALPRGSLEELIRRVKDLDMDDVRRQLEAERAGQTTGDRGR